MFIAHFDKHGTCVWRSPGDYPAGVAPGERHWDTFYPREAKATKLLFWNCLQGAESVRIEARCLKAPLVYLGCYYHVGCPLVAVTSTGVFVNRAFRTLSRRERDVLAALATEGGIKSVARKLGIAAGTVGSHVSSIRAKLKLLDLADVQRFALMVMSPNWLGCGPS